VERWGFLAERPQGATDAYVVSRGVLLLRTLFGVQLWGSPHKIHNILLSRNEQAPAFTTNIPTQILDTCTFLIDRPFIVLTETKLITKAASL